MSDKLKISYPHIGDYHIPIRCLLREIFPDAEICTPSPITRKTIELGSRYSPDYVCSPFKYNIGNYIEALEQGANVLLQTGTGCRYGYYGETQEQILKDLGYSFTFLCFSREKASFPAIYDSCKALNQNLTKPKLLRAVAKTLQRIRLMDKLDYVLRERIGFEVYPGSFEREKRCFLKELEEAKTFQDIRYVYGKYRERYDMVLLDIPKKVLQVGIVGELYTLMEPESNFHLERELAKQGISVSRKMSATFLLLGRSDVRSLQGSAGYLRYTVGANGVDSVAQCKEYAKKGYDGVLHIKSFGCTPELNAQPALMNISRDYHIPVLHLSFDTQTSETGLRTRVEAFADMIKLKEGSRVWQKG